MKQFNVEDEMGIGQLGGLSVGPCIEGNVTTGISLITYYHRLFLKMDDASPLPPVIG